MTVKVQGVNHDAMGEACRRLDISRQTMLRYFEIGYFTKPNTVRQGRKKDTRYFDKNWYSINERKLIADRNAGQIPAESSQTNGLAAEDESQKAYRNTSNEGDGQNQVAPLMADNIAPKRD